MAEVTFSATAELETPESVAAICVVPAACPRATPFCAPMVATASFEEAHATVEETSCVDPSLKVPMAENCCVPPGAIEEVGGEIAMDLIVALVMVRGTPGLTTPVCVELEDAGPRTIGEPGACAN
jgi:hypothetical protein